MNDKSKLQASLSRLLKRQEADEGTSLESWLRSETVRRGRLDLSRAGEEDYSTHVLDVRREDDQSLTLIVARLTPRPDESFWHEPVSLNATITGFDAGMEEIATFRCLVGERVDHDGEAAVELRDMRDLERRQQEYVAPLGPGHAVEFSFVWYDEWVAVKPKKITIRRLFFHADLEGFASPDGYSLSRAMLKLEKGGSAVPVKVQLTRGRNSTYEAELTTIDGVFRQKLTGLVEEIWRTEAGLSSRRAAPPQPDVGYMTRPADRDDDKARPAVVLAGNDPAWEELLTDFGDVISHFEANLDTLTETLSEHPCILFVGDADLWGARAVAVERLLRSVSRYRNMPRFWITSEDVGQPWEAGDVVLTGEEDGGNGDLPSGTSGPLDHVDYGAFDLLPREMDRAEALRRLRWAVDGDAFGRGESVLLVTQDPRLRYRLGLSLMGESGVRFVVFDRVSGLLPTLEKRRPRWILLDATSFEVEVDPMLARSAEWTAHNRGHVIVLARGVGPERVTEWLKRGASDIVLLDPSLREAMRRLRHRVLRLDE